MTSSVVCVTVYMPNLLQCLKMPIVDQRVCENAYPGMISPRMVCAGYMEGGKDACNVSLTVTFSQMCVCVRINHMLTHCVSSPGWLWQPSGVWGRGARPGVMGSGMCRAKLPRGLRQTVWVPLLVWRGPGSQSLKKLPVYFLHFSHWFTALVFIFLLSGANQDS